MRSEYALVIPAYNEASTIREVAAGALRHVERVIVVDDGSSDGTAAALAGLPVILLRNTVNQGKAASLRRGMVQALEEGVEAVITMDGDGQHATDDIPRLLAAARQHPGAIVIGARVLDRHNMPRVRHLANRFANFWVAWAAGYPMSDSQSGFRLYPAAALRAVDIAHNRSGGFVFESEILIDAARSGVRSVAVPIAAIYRENARASHFRPMRDVLGIARMLVVKIVGRGFCVPGLIRSLQRDGRASPGYSRSEVGKSAERS